MITYQIILDYKFESLNKIMRMHWAVRKKRQEEIMAALEYAAMSKPPKFYGKVRLTIIRQWGKRGRAFDPDNLVASCKMLIDCLKEPKGRSNYGLGIIKDDSSADIELLVRQEKSPDGVHRAIIKFTGDILGDKDV
ncbi:MAG: hypothetical protein Unbinned4614contig1000_22 [Prokaryotic dsDNA virus sp.]|nr:MAG: hypothetical protein Unbinned4614contig1000_22 [Prokaryotic dsDNA virus sp.]